LKSSEINRTLIDAYLRRHPENSATVLSSVDEEKIVEYLRNQPFDTVRILLLRLGSEKVQGVISRMANAQFIDLFNAIDPYTSAILLSKLTDDEREKRIELLLPRLSKEIREILSYPPDSAGFLMDTKVLTFQLDSTVEDVLDKLRKLGDKRIVNVYIVDGEGRLMGYTPIQIVAISPVDEIMRNVMEKSVSIHVMAPQEEVVQLLQDRKIFGLPVVDLDDKLLGIIRNDTLIQTAQREAIEDVQTIFGAGREERALSRVSFAIRKRLPWLEINLATAFLAAAVVGIFEDTIAKITVLAVFLPVVAGQSGNTGSQALAVTIRGLALREIRVSQWFRVARKEMTVGLINGVFVAVSTAIIVYLWAASFGLSIVIAVSMVFSMIIAGFSGAVIPIALKSVGQDPAQSSSIILTTVTDVVGFLSFLGLASMLVGIIVS
jgi:magnesium transporter